MSFDRRLREELQREAAAIEPDVERQLGAVEAGARHRRGVSAPTLVVAAAIIIAALVLRLPDQQGTGGPGPSAQPSPRASPTASPSLAVSYSQIAGTYKVTLNPTNATVKQYGVGGTWTMQLEPSGAVALIPPAIFLAGANSLSGIAYSIAADRFRTDLFYNNYCDSVGNYVWYLAAGRLTFTSVDDACSIRVTLLTSSPWLVVK
jgi:hypothetical protein